MEAYPMRWLRLYDELLDDPKVQELQGEAFKVWINLLCLANRGKPRGRIARDRIPFSLRVSQERTDKMVAYFIEQGLLTEENGYLVPHGWDARQFQSDNVTERVVKHRRNVTRNVTRNDVETLDETPPDTDTDTDTDTTPLYPPLRGARSTWNERWEIPGEWIDHAKAKGLGGEEASAEAVKFVNYWLGEGKPKADWFATWRTWVENSKTFARPRTNGKEAGPVYYADIVSGPAAEAVREAERDRVLSAYFRQCREAGMTRDEIVEQQKVFAEGLQWTGSTWVNPNEMAPPECAPAVTQPRT